MVILPVLIFNFVCLAIAVGLNGSSSVRETSQKAFLNEVPFCDFLKLKKLYNCIKLITITEVSLDNYLVKIIAELREHN